MRVGATSACFLIVITCSEFLVSRSDANIDGDVKLGDAGIVQVYNSYVNDYINICYKKSVSDSVANTICRQMGLAKSISSEKINWKRSKQSLKKIVVESCSSDASHIYRCKYSVLDFCASNMVTAVTCEAAEYVYEGQLRLHEFEVDGNTSTYPTQSYSGGKLQVYLNKKWTFVCNETFGENEANTACRQLGYTISRNHIGEMFNGSSLVVWIGFGRKFSGRVDCDESKDCLTKCYSKPTRERNCANSALVYLQCDFVVQNVNWDHSSAGTPSACAIKEETSSKRNTASVAGIVLGSISLMFFCICGILLALYCCSTAKRPPYNPLDDKLDYSYAEGESNSSKEPAETEEECETSFNHSMEYRPPVITQLAAQNNNNDK